MRKRIFDIVGILALLVGVVALSATVSLRPAPDNVDPQAVAERFKSFPVGEHQSFDFDFSSEAFRRASDLERKMQAADWMLLAIVGDAGLPVDGLQKVLFDLPPARFDFLEGTSNLEYGETRSRSMEGGEVIALIPAADLGVQRDYVAAVADRERKNTGSKAKLLRVFEYTLDEDSSSGTVTRLPDLAGSDVFSAAYGYFEQPVTSRADLGRFMTIVDDLTGIQNNANRIVLSGRKVAHLKYRGIRLEDVAALWKAEEKIQAVENAIRNFDARWSNRTYRYDYERVTLERERDKEWEALSLSLGVDAGSESRATHTGFSLDPVFDFDKLQSLYGLLKPLIEESSLAAKADEVKSGLARKQEEPLLSLLYELGQSKSEDDQALSEFAKELLEATQFQHARYDGDLKGTEVGMILFYTDLLAKLYALDYTGASPEGGVVPDFVSLLHLTHAPIYDKEMRARSNTRLWFGVLDDGFQTVDSGVLFARTSTRVYAAGSDPLQPGKESEPNVESARFLGWWNNHYDAIARFEPEYQRLNEVMKWSIALAWLKEKSTFDSLSFLAEVDVDRSARFPAWVTKHPELRFKRWDRIKFFPENYKNLETESLPLLQSEFFNGSGLSGGVSLASKEIIAERPLLNRSLSESLRRPNFAEAFENGNQVLRRVDKTSFEFQPSVSSLETGVKIRPRPEAKFRGLEMEIRNQPLDIKISRETSGLRVGMKVGETPNRGIPVGDANVVRTRTGFRVGLMDEQFRSQNRVLRSLSEAPGGNAEWATILEKDPSVERAILSQDSKSVAVRLKGTREWQVIQPEGAPSTDLPEGAEFRFASLSGDSPSLRLTVRTAANEEKAIEEIGGGAKWNASSDSANPRVAKLNREQPPTGKAMPEMSRNANDAMDQRMAGRLLAEDGYISYIAERNRALDVIDQKIVSGKLSSTDLLEVDAYCRRFQYDPNVQARGAIAKAEGGDIASAASDLNVMLQKGNTGALEQALKKADAPSLKNTAAIRDAVALHKSYTNGGVGKDVVLLPSSDGLRVEIRLADLSQASEPFTPAAGTKPLVYEGGPAFIRSNETVAVEANATRRLTNWDVLMPAPDQIRDLKTGTVYRLSKSDTLLSAETTSAGTAVRFPRLNRPMPGCSSDSRDSAQTGCNNEIVLRTLPPGERAALTRPAGSPGA